LTRLTQAMQSVDGPHLSLDSFSSMLYPFYRTLFFTWKTIFSQKKEFFV